MVWVRFAGVTLRISLARKHSVDEQYQGFGVRFLFCLCSDPQQPDPDMFIMWFSQSAYVVLLYSIATSACLNLIGTH